MSVSYTDAHCRKDEVHFGLDRLLDTIAVHSTMFCVSGDSITTVAVSEEG